MWDFVGTQRNRYLHFIDNVCNEVVSAKSGTLIKKKKNTKVWHVQISLFLYFICVRDVSYILLLRNLR